MLHSAVSVLVVAQSIFEILEGLMNNPVYGHDDTLAQILPTLAKRGRSMGHVTLCTQ